MGSGNRKTCDPYRLLLNLSDKKEVINPDKGGLFESSFFLRVEGGGGESGQFDPLHISRGTTLISV